MNPEISIIIPTYNHGDLTAHLLLDILQYCSPANEVIIANNGSDDPAVAAGIKWWKSIAKLSLKEFRAAENVGFLKICNLSVEKAKGDIIILISNDVNVRADLTKLVLEILKDARKIVGGILYDHDTGWNQFDGKIFSYLEGWLLAFHKKDWEIIGGFDERYSPHIFEDIDFSTMAIKKGYNLIPLNESRIWHSVGQTIKYGPERDKLTSKNKEKFRKKWIKEN